jgi:hypothetical protein
MYRVCVVDRLSTSRTDVIAPSAKYRQIDRSSVVVLCVYLITMYYGLSFNNVYELALRLFWRVVHSHLVRNGLQLY